MSQLSALVRRFIPPTFRYEARAFIGSLKTTAMTARLWRWDLVSLKREGRDYEVLFLGLKDDLKHACAALNIDRSVAQAGRRSINSNTVLVSHAPLPDGLKVPQNLHMVVPLDRSLDEIMKGYDGELRRKLRAQRPKYTMSQVTSDEEIARLFNTMLEPYAQARHGEDATSLQLEYVARIAQSTGRLDLIKCGDEEVACHLGYIVPPKRSWVTLRFGYPATVFNDKRRLGDANAMNTFLALEWALENGYGCYDMGSCVGQPDNGLLQWKRRRAGCPDASFTDTFLWVRLPRSGAAELLWDAPLFAMEGDGMALHIGLPAAHTDEEAIERYRQMRFGLISSVYIHSSRQPGAKLMESLRGLFSNVETPPQIETVGTA